MELIAYLSVKHYIHLIHYTDILQILFFSLKELYNF